jgi:hypothetical protein
VWNLVFKSAATFSYWAGKAATGSIDTVSFREVNEHVVNGGMHVSLMHVFTHMKNY